MNHLNKNINESKSNSDKKETRQSQSILQEKDLKEIYNTQYNDLFPKILTKTKSEFLPLLKSQVSLHLKIINKTALNSLNEKYIDIYTKKFFSDKVKANKGYEEIIKNVELQKNNLELINCYIHCHKCTNILHSCKNKLILHKDFIYCIHCQKVYNENQIKLYCEECKCCYYSKLRYVFNKKYENFYNVCFKDYHCKINEQEKIKCLECGHDLYYNILYDKKNLKKDSITEIFCLKCKLLFDLNEVFFKCKKCKSNFKSEAKIYNNFSLLRIQFLLIMHILRKKKLASPEKRLNRKCKCDINKYEKYLHEEDNGVLYLGHNLNGEYIILCDSCYSIFNYNDFIWTCPLCKVNFKSKKNLYKKNYMKKINYLGEEIISKIEKTPTMFKSPSNVNIFHRKKILESIPSSSGDKAYKYNIVKNLFNKNNGNINNNHNKSEQKLSRNNNKFNHMTKVILFTSNKKNKIVNNTKNLSEQKLKKVHLFKKIKDINIKNNNNYHTTVNEPIKENNLRKKNNNYTNNNTINSMFNSVNSTKNKTDTNTNTNKCSDSTNITSKNNEVVNELNIIKEKEKSHIYVLEQDQTCGSNNNISRINRKLIYNGFIENEKNPLNNLRGNEIKEKKLCKSSKKEKESINYLIVKKERINHKKLEIKKINNSLFNRLNSEKEILDSINNNPKKKVTINNLIKTNDNVVIVDSKEIKKKIFKSMKNIRANNNNSNIKMIKSSNNIKINNNLIQNQSSKQNKQIVLTSQNSVNRIRLIKTNRNSKEKLPEFNDIENNQDSNKENNNSNKDNKKIMFKEKKQITKCPTQFFFQNMKDNNGKKNINVISIIKKLKDYYEEGLNDESLFSKEQKKLSKKNNKLKLNKSVALTSRKKIMYKADFKSENYSILKLLGKGTYAKTYLVEDPKTKERFALKKITINDKIELKENKEEYNLILKLTKEFPELKIINIYGIEIKNLDKYNTVMYILMEAAKYDWEKEIMKHFDSGSYYKEDYLLNILYELVKSFAILQRKGICHRDVKPQNILCFPDDEYKISDFGEAKNFRKTMIMNNFNKNNLGDNTMEQTLRGTELYMSPILFQALRSRSNQFVTYNSYKSDVFSLGMCFFLASSLSYEGLYEIREILKNGNKTRLVVNRYLRKKYSQKYLNILIAMLQINERDRPDFVELEKMAENICNK
jgi:hypothetical protein